MKKDAGCANCGAQRVEGSTLCADCLPDEFLKAVGRTAREIRKQRGLIDALRASNDRRQEIINSLSGDLVGKSFRILDLERQVEKLLREKYTVKTGDWKWKKQGE